jgi:alkanesulfonate monooxygenase SsuD/methylene tetrahydromethanopterin reductase-like flavin-dependent oxidoreductase (luciferase family)
MRVGLQLQRFDHPGGPASTRATLVAIAQSAEANGFSSLWVMDHLLQLPEDTGLGGPEQPMLEAYTTLGFLASATERIALGPMVANAVLRPPGLLVKAATTLDVLAGDRSTYFAVGSAWYQREAVALGLPWASRSERIEHLEETLRVARAMFGGDRAAIDGRHHQLHEPINVPPPLSRPRIMVGGGGERKTLRLVAQYADACNILVPDPGESRRKLGVLARHCEAIGRDVAEIETTSLVEADLRPGHGTVAAVTASLRQQAEEGIEHVIVNLPDAHVLDRLDTFGREIIPAVA